MSVSPQSDIPSGGGGGGGGGPRYGNARSVLKLDKARVCEQLQVHPDDIAHYLRSTTATPTLPLPPASNSNNVGATNAAMATPRFPSNPTPAQHANSVTRQNENSSLLDNSLNQTAISGTSGATRNCGLLVDDDESVFTLEPDAIEIEGEVWDLGCSNCNTRINSFNSKHEGTNHHHHHDHHDGGGGGRAAMKDGFVRDFVYSEYQRHMLPYDRQPLVFSASSTNNRENDVLLRRNKRSPVERLVLFRDRFGRINIVVRVGRPWVVWVIAFLSVCCGITAQIVGNKAGLEHMYTWGVQGTLLGAIVWSIITILIGKFTVYTTTYLKQPRHWKMLVTISCLSGVASVAKLFCSGDLRVVHMSPMVLMTLRPVFLKYVDGHSNLLSKEVTGTGILTIGGILLGCTFGTPSAPFPALLYCICTATQYTAISAVRMHIPTAFFLTIIQFISLPIELAGYCLLYRKCAWADVFFFSESVSLYKAMALVAVILLNVCRYGGYFHILKYLNPLVVVSFLSVDALIGYAVIVLTHHPNHLQLLLPSVIIVLIGLGLVCLHSRNLDRQVLLDDDVVRSVNHRTPTLFANSPDGHSPMSPPRKSPRGPVAIQDTLTPSRPEGISQSLTSPHRSLKQFNEHFDVSVPQHFALGDNEEQT